MHANIGRPSRYSDDIAVAICTEIAAGLPLRDVAKMPDMPPERTLYAWLVAHEPFQQMYARAREQRVERWSDEIIELADEPVAPNDNAAVQRARLRVDTRKWLMSKLAPRKYGDKIEHVVRSGAPETLSDEELARIAASASPALLTLSANPDSDSDTGSVQNNPEKSDT